MPRSKTKVKVVTNSKVDVKELNKMFEQLTGSQAADPHVIYPKLTSLKNNLVKLDNVFKIFLGLKNTLIQFDCQKDLDDIQEFLTKMKVDCKIEKQKYTEADFMTKDEKEVQKEYAEIKKSEFIKKIIITAGNLVSHKKHLEDSKNLSDSFIKREPGLKMCPFEFSDLDLMYIWAEASDLCKKCILTVLHHTLTIGLDLHKITTSPDIDVKKFSAILVDAISSMQSQVPRCEMAFKSLRDSVGMLENNFGTYYRDSVEASNPSVIMENFVVDVSRTQKSSVKLTMQFGRIISHIKKKTQASNDPKTKMMFNMLNSQFNLLKKETEKKETDNKKDTPQQLTLNSTSKTSPKK